MKALAAAGLLLGLSVFHPPLHAQTYPCSNPGPGEVVVGQTDGGNGVAPMQLCERTGSPSAPAQTQPQVRWQSTWGAIAADVSPGRGIIGSSSGALSPDEAMKKAMADCAAKGGAKCTLQTSFSNACGVLLVGDKTFNVNWGDSVETATKKGMDVCNAGDTGCYVYFKICSPAVRVQ